MKSRPASESTPLCRRAWLAVTLLPLLSGCIAAVAVPLVAGGALSAAKRHRVGAATPVPDGIGGSQLATANARSAVQAVSNPELSSMKALPPPSGAAAFGPEESWHKFFAYALSQRPAEEKSVKKLSALLVELPPLDAPAQRKCVTSFPAVIIDLDGISAPFAPEHLASAPPAVAAGLAELRQQGIVVLWISQLPASRAADVAQALRTSGLDPQGQDQLLLVRNKDDRKQLLRQDANQDVCIVAIAGDEQSDFDELFKYLRVPGSAVGLYPMMGDGWFLVPPLEDAPADGG